MTTRNSFKYLTSTTNMTFPVLGRTIAVASSSPFSSSFSPLLPSANNTMAAMAFRHGASLWCPHPLSLAAHKKAGTSGESFRPRFAATVSAALINKNKEYVIVGGGNAAGYAVREFVESGKSDGKLCVVSKEKVVPYERPALTKAYLFPLDKSPARLPGFHTCVGVGAERQTPDWYKEKGVEVLHDVTVTGLDTESQTLSTSSGDTIKYGTLIIATGCTSAKLPESIGGSLKGVHYIRDVADADDVVASLQTAKKVVIIGGGYIGMEVAAATSAWKLDTTVVFPEAHLMPRLFTPTIAQKYEDLYMSNGIKFIKGKTVKKLTATGNDGRVSSVELSDGTVIEADMVVVGIGAKPVVGPFADAGIKITEGGIAVDGQFRTSHPGIWAIGDVAAFPLKIYDRISRVEHVDHARKSARHCVNALLHARTNSYDYLPYFYSRVFEHPGSTRKVWWQFYGDNVGEAMEFGDFNPKYAAFWLESGRLKGVYLESGSPEEFSLLPELARRQPHVDKSKLQKVSSAEEALKVAQEALQALPAGAL